MSPFTKYFSAVVIAALTIPLVSIKSNALVSAKSSNSTSAGVLLGPLSSPGAEGPIGRNDRSTIRRVYSTRDDDETHGRRSTERAGRGHVRPRDRIHHHLYKHLERQRQRQFAADCIQPRH